MPKGKRGPRPDDRPKANGDATDTIMQCRNCIFTSHDEAEMIEHLNGMNHRGFDDVPVKPPAPELFSGPKQVKRDLAVALSGQELLELHAKSAQIAIGIVSQHEIIANGKAALKALEHEQAEVVATLRQPVKTVPIVCEWRDDVESHSKKLVRLDSGAVLEEKALSAEDRSRIEKESAAKPMEATA